MLFGLCNAPSMFQATMNDLFFPFICKFILLFSDVILVYSWNFEDHMEHLKRVLHTLQQGEFYFKPSKCSFKQWCIDYLGHIVSANGVELEPSRFRQCRTSQSLFCLNLYQVFWVSLGFIDASLRTKPNLLPP